MIKVGLIGFGLAGQAFHAPVIQAVEGMELACILERRTSQAREKYPNVRLARTMDEFLSDGGIQLCVVATPNDSHFELSRACLAAGWHVVVDKPFAPTLGEAEELVRLAAKAGRLITVYQDRRWDGEFQTLRKIVHSGTLGEIAEYEARFDRFRPQPKGNAWRERKAQPAAGVLWDLGPHLIDQALVLFGEPETVWATAFRQRQASTMDDSFDVHMEYPYLRTTLRARILAYGLSHHFLIHGLEGSFVKYGMDPQEEILRSEHPPEGLDWGADWGEEPESLWGTLSRVDEPIRKG